MSHGLFRVPGYVTSLRNGKVNGHAKPAVTQQTAAVIRVDGDNGYAPLALERGIPALVKAAKDVGIGVMAITRSFHFAALWPETEAIARENLIGLACGRSRALVAPHGGKEPIFGTNPFSFAWPRPGKKPVVIDMATSSRAMGEIQVAARDGHSVPLGTGLDANGELTTDPAEIMKGVLLPFGGYKGSGIALMVELLAAAATGERFSYESATEPKDGGPARGGEFLLAISPDTLAGPDWPARAEGFFERYEAIQGARLPGARRLGHRILNETRDVDAALVERIRALC